MTQDFCSAFLIAKFCHQVFCTSYGISCNIGNCVTLTLSKANMSNNNKRPQHDLHFTLHTDQVKTPFMKAECFYSLNKQMLNFTNIGKLFPFPQKVSNYKTLLRASCNAFCGWIALIIGQKKDVNMLFSLPDSDKYTKFVHEWVFK